MKLLKSVDLRLESVGPVFVVGCLLAIMVFAPGNAATNGVTKMRKDNAKYDTPSKEKPDTANKRDAKAGLSQPNAKPATATWDTSSKKADTANTKFGTSLSKSAPYQSPL